MTPLRTLCAGQLPRLVMFDLDGTLVDSVPDLAAAVDRMLLQLGRKPAGVGQVRHWVGNGALVLVRRALAGSIEHAGVDDAEAEAALALFMEAYAEAGDLTQRYPGVLECLTALQEAGVLLALITNKPERFIPGLLQEQQMDGFFRWVIGGDTLARRKPDPDGLLWVMQQAGITAEHSLFVGDSRNDILAARAAGVRSVALTYGYNHGEDIRLQQPDLVIDNLMELLEGDITDMGY